MPILSYITGLAGPAVKWLFHSPLAKTLLIALLGIVGYRTVIPVPSRELIIKELMVDPRMMVAGTLPNATLMDIRPLSPSLYVKYTIICIPIDRGAVCDTAAHTFRFVAAQGAVPEAKVAGQDAALRPGATTDTAGRAIFWLDLPAQVSGKDVVDITAPIVGPVGAKDLDFESPTDGNLLERKMECGSAQIVGDGSMTILCVEIPSLRERLAALFDLKLR